MKKIQTLVRRFFAPVSAEKEALAQTREVREAVEKKKEVMYWLYDIGKYGPMNK